MARIFPIPRPLDSGSPKPEPDERWVLAPGRPSGPPSPGPTEPIDEPASKGTTRGVEAKPNAEEPPLPATTSEEGTRADLGALEDYLELTPEERTRVDTGNAEDEAELDRSMVTDEPR